MRSCNALVYAAGLIVALSAPTLNAQVTSKANLPASYRPEFGTMWTFDAPPLEYWKTRYNFTPDQGWLDNVRLAAVRLPNCSASFVSENGLVMTNHHCARQSISAASPADTNYQRTGFVAPTVNEEKKCTGLYVDQLVGIEDVTARVQGKVTSTVAAQRVEQRNAEIAAIQKDCTSGNMNCQVVAFYQGGMYSLYKYRRFNDVRIVMAPEEAISFFGGDPDNFTFPRFDLDVTLLRVYENDQPHRPQDYLKWSANGATEGELVFVTGNPGSTGRLLTVAQMEYLRDVTYPAQLAQLARQIATFKGLIALGGESAQRRFENALFSAENSQKAIKGYLSGLLDEKQMARKRAFEKDLRARIAADAKLRVQYGSAWAAIEAAQREQSSMARQARYYNLTGSNLLSIAAGLTRMPQQAALADTARLAGFRGPALTNLRNQLSGQIPVDTMLERVNLTAWLVAAQQELDPKDPLLVTVLAGRKPEQAATDLLKATQLGDLQVRRALVEGGASAIAASNDPLIQIARKLAPASLQIAQRNARLNSLISANAERVGQAQFAVYGKKLPPDATFTLRISDGVVKGFPYNGTIAPYKTSFYGLFARSAEFDNQPPFELPERWRQAERRINLATPLDFVSTNDIIGGNSGSPVINRNAEVVGLIFDSNIEALPNRFIFTDEVARSVSVHSRAITEALRNVFGAAWIADELEGR